MRTIRVGIADALDNGQLSLLQELIESTQAGVEADLIIDTDELILLVTQRGAGLVVEIIGVRDDGIEAVIAAGHFDDDEDVVLAHLSGASGVGDEVGHHGAEGKQRRALQRASQERAAG